MKLIALFPVAFVFAAGSAAAQEPPASPVPQETLGQQPPPPSYAQAPVETAPPPEKPACGLIHRPCSFPHFALALEGGVSVGNESGPFAFDTGIGSVLHAGPSWGLRGGIELLSWFAIDVHYIGMDNHALGEAEPAGGVSLLTNALNAELRFTVPIKYVQPYFFSGVGYYSTSVTGSDSAKAGSPLHGSSELGVPIGLGVGIPVTNAISVGGEVTYHRLFGEEFSKNEDFGGGEFTTFNAVVRARL